MDYLERNVVSTTTEKRPAGSPLSKAIMAGLGIGMLAVSLAACAATGPEPVALNQDPGSNAPPTASSP